MSSTRRPVLIRSATTEDAAAIARIHVESWQAAYAGLLPDEFLRGLSIPDRQRHWEQRLRAARRPSVVLVVAEDGVPAGFAAAGPSRDDDANTDTAELVAIYLDPRHWRRGLGRLLHDHVIAELHDDGYRLATLWVLDTNSSARRFYDRAGWVLDGATKIDSRAGVPLNEVRYRKAPHASG